MVDNFIIRFRSIYIYVIVALIDVIGFIEYCRTTKKIGLLYNLRRFQVEFVRRRSTDLVFELQKFVILHDGRLVDYCTAIRLGIIMFFFVRRRSIVV